MRLRTESIGKKVKRPYWSPGQFYEIKHFGRAIVIAEDEFGKEVLFDRDDRDYDWEFVGYGRETTH